MSAGPRYWGIVPAAGLGERMQAGKPKQYLSVAGATVLEHTLMTMLDWEWLDGVVVVLSQADQYWPQLSLSAHPRVKTTIGGSLRQDSVLAGLRALAADLGESDWVLVHDAARPCLGDEVERLRDDVSDDPVGGLLALPIADTVKEVNDEGRVYRTLDRTHLWLAQTPQMFRFGVLRDALEQACRAVVEVTDEAAAIERAGLAARVVEGSPRNIKLTRPADLAVVARYLAGED